nr:uncharacterized protein LOC129464220 [Symphalangus syndactylus]
MEAQKMWERGSTHQQRSFGFGLQIAVTSEKRRGNLFEKNVSLQLRISRHLQARPAGIFERYLSIHCPQLRNHDLRHCFEEVKTPPLKWPRSVIQEDEHTEPSSALFENSVETSVGKAVKPARSDCEGLCWNLAARRLGEKPHAGSHSAGPFSSSFGSFTQPCTQWLHKADYKLQRIPEGAKSDAGANEPREPLIPVTEWDKLGKAWTTQIQGSPGSRKPALGTGGHYPPYSAGPGDPGGPARPARAGAPPPARAGDGGNPAGRCGQAGAEGAGLGDMGERARQQATWRVGSAQLLSASKLHGHVSAGAHRPWTPSSGVALRPFSPAHLSHWSSLLSAWQRGPAGSDPERDSDRTREVGKAGHGAVV